MAWLLSLQVTAQTTLVSFGSSWRYLDNGSNQGTAWRSQLPAPQGSFDESGWKTGVGKFGYGIGDAATQITSGPASSKYITTYFRKVISVTDPVVLGTITANVKRDDGVVIYVNGTEVLRNNMPTGSIAYNTLASKDASDSGTKIQSFAFSGLVLVPGANLVAVEIHQSKANTSDMAFDLELVSQDKTPPTVVSIDRQSPSTATTSETQLTFRATFSEKVKGVDPTDFSLSLTGSATGLVSTSTAVTSDNSTYDVTVTGVSGDGTLRLDLKPSGTSIKDMAGNTINGGFTGGQAYTVQQPVTTQPGFASITNLTPLSISTNTADKPQSKTWMHGGKQWAVLPDSAGIYLWRLDGTSWTRQLKVSSGTSARADCKKVGDLTHILLFRGNNTSYLVTIQYVAATGTYQLWQTQPARVSLTFEQGTETATLDLDGNGRMWIASDSSSTVLVRWSDSPYTNWSKPITLASGIQDDDICTLIAMPGKIGVLWSDQNARQFGFRTHANGTDPAIWTADEVPASQSALNIGTGFADDHLNIKVAADGTLYCAVKTSYETLGYPKLVLLVRRPNGVWDNAYEVTNDGGTRPCVILNETTGKLRIVYSSVENGGDILYKESSTSAISFGGAFTLIKGLYNYVSSSKENLSSEAVILVTNVAAPLSLKAVGWLVSDGVSTAQATSNQLAVTRQEAQAKSDLMFTASKNPFSTSTSVRFSLPEGGPYTLSLYDGVGKTIRILKEGTAAPKDQITASVEGDHLHQGLYFVRLQAAASSKTLRLLLVK
ncbi:hypothetical protein [Rufibacter soli]